LRLGVKSFLLNLPRMFRSAVFLLFVAGALLGGASSAAVAGEGLEPDALLPAKDGQPARIVYVQAQASTRSMIAAFRSEGSAPPAPWSELLPEWSKRARREANDGLWEYALVETASGPGAPKESEILDWLLERKPFPQAPPDSPPALLLFEISGADFRALAQTRDLASGRHDFALPEGFRREARPWVADARKLDAANRFGGRLGLIIRGPAHGSPESAAFLLQAAQIAQSLAPVRLARLRVEPEGLRLVVAETAPSGLREPWTADRVDAWIDETLNAVWDAISRTPDAEALDRLRDQVLLQRRLSFEQPGSRLDFIARRLAAAEPEAVFAEEAALAAATPHDWKTSARAWLAEPEIEVWLPALPAGLSTESAPSAPMAESRRFYQFVHQRTDKDELACVCLLVGLPGGPMGERTFREKSWWGRRREVREAVPISTREEAALMWRALALWAIRERPEASARTAIALPSPLPGAGGADPYGANQYSAIVLQADAEHLPELLDLTATFLGRELSGQPQVETTLAEFDAGRKLLDPARLEAYQQTLRDQARLLAGTSAEAIFERRLKTDAENNLAAAFETLINPANLVIAVSAPADAASVADYLDLRFERAFGDERGRRARRSPDAPAFHSVAPSRAGLLPDASARA
jgi:hypothetical protein